MADMSRIRREPMLPMQPKPVAMNDPGEVVMADVEKELKPLVRGMNIAAPPPPIPRELTKPEGLGQEIAKSMVEAAEAVSNEVQSHLEQTRMRAEKIREDIKNWADEHDALVKRFQELGKSTLESYRVYTKENSLPDEGGS
jgi:hypothetical protein